MVVWDWYTVTRVLLNPIFLDCQSNPNPLQIYDWQSKSKSTFQNGLTIQSKSNHNPTKNIFISIFNYNLIYPCYCLVPRDHFSTPNNFQTFLTLSTKIGLALKYNFISIFLIRNKEYWFLWIWIAAALLDCQSKSKSNF